MVGDYTENRILLGNSTEPKTSPDLYYASARLYVRGTGGGGTIRIAPSVNNAECGVGFYSKNDFT